MYRVLLNGKFKRFSTLDELQSYTNKYGFCKYITKDWDISEEVLNLDNLSEFIQYEDKTPLVVLCRGQQDLVFYCPTYSLFLNNLSMYYSMSFNSNEYIEVYRICDLLDAN